MRLNSYLVRKEDCEKVKTLAEIYTMHSFAHLCSLYFLSKFCQEELQLIPILAYSHEEITRDYVAVPAPAPARYAAAAAREGK